MRGRRASLSFASLAAWLAVALLTLAGVRSAVMQVAEARGATPMCAEGGRAGQAPAPDGKAHAPCDFCAAAAQAALTADPPALPTPCAVAYVVAAATATLGPRGPPALRPRARSPPLLTA